MQFHRDGYRPGDPRVAAPAPDVADSGRDRTRDEVDVLVVGCGPAGLTLAAQLSRFPDIRTRIVEQLPGPLERGRADGIAVRTMEMFEALGFAEEVARESYWVNETTFWGPDDDDPTRIVRGGQVQDVEDGLSAFPHVILNQARVHDQLLDAMARSPRRLRPDYARRVVALAVDESVRDDDAARPVTVTLATLDEASEEVGERSTVRARYVVGCDGGHSTVRDLVGLALRGDSANKAWGVMDVLAVTDFPDIRLKSAIRSAREGSLLVIPREGGHLVRLYVELDSLAEGERVRTRAIDSDHLVAAARRMLHPYELDVREVVWWSVYEIGQRLCDHFDDRPRDGPSHDGGRPRVFIAGDAGHTHSPKAGQGMNVSMRDAFNLGWKLAAVLQGRSPASLLATYSAERQAVARELIDFDREFAARFSARVDADDSDRDAPPADDRFQDYFVRHARFTAGVATRYARSAIVGEPVHQRLAGGLPIGMRFHSAPVVRLADARPLHLGSLLVADGRWRLLAFADRDGVDDDGALTSLCTALAAPDSVVRRVTSADGDADAVLDVRAVLQQGHREVELGDVPSLLRPAVGALGLTDFEKVLCADPRAGDVYDLRGIDRDRGCLVVVRPDQYVAHVLPLDAVDELAAFLDPVLLPAG